MNLFLSFDSMGSTWNIYTNQTQEEELKKLITTQASEFDAQFSRFKKTSLIQKISKQAGIYNVPTDLIEMLKIYKQLYTPSNKTFTPLIGKTLEDIGYDEHYSLKEQQTLTQTPDLDTVLQIQNSTTIKLTQPVLIDIGGIGKGYFVDKIASILASHNITEYLIDGSGDILHKGAKAIQTALEDPNNTTKAIGIATFQNGSMCASATNRRTWKKWHHIVNPHTNTSDNTIIATWVYAQSTALADALATALFLAPPEAFHEQQFEYLIMNNARKIKKSAGFPAELFLK